VCVCVCRELFSGSFFAYVQLLGSAREHAHRAAQARHRRQVRHATHSRTRMSDHLSSACWRAGALVSPRSQRCACLCAVRCGAVRCGAVCSVPKKLLQRHRDDAAAVLDKLAASLTYAHRCHNMHARSRVGGDAASPPSVHVLPAGLLAHAPPAHTPCVCLCLHALCMCRAMRHAIAESACAAAQITRLPKRLFAKRLTRGNSD